MASFSAPESDTSSFRAVSGRSGHQGARATAGNVANQGVACLAKSPNLEVLIHFEFWDACKRRWIRHGHASHHITVNDCGRDLANASYFVNENRTMDRSELETKGSQCLLLIPIACQNAIVFFSRRPP